MTASGRHQSTPCWMSAVPPSTAAAKHTKAASLFAILNSRVDAEPTPGAGLDGAAYMLLFHA